MKTFLSLFFTFAALCLASCETNGPQSERYSLCKQELMRIREKSLHHTPITDEDGLDSLYVFFKQYGTEEELFLASYYKGLYLYQMGDIKSSFIILREAYNNQPTQPSELSRKILLNILDWMQVRYIQERNAEELSKWIDEAESAGVYDNCRHYQLLERKACLFDIVEKPDSTRKYMLLAYNDMLRHPEWDENKSMILAEIAGWFAQRGEHAAFLEMYDAVKRHPFRGANDANDYFAGLYYNQIGQRDSAMACFRLATHASPDIARHAYLQLAIIAHNNARHDSVFACFQGYVTASDSLLLLQQKESTQKLEAAFKVREQEKHIAQQRIYILTLLVLLLFTTSAVAIGWRMMLKVRRNMAEKAEELKREKQEHSRLLIQLQEAIEMSQHEKAEEGSDRKLLLEKKMAEIRTMDSPHSCLSEAEKHDLSQLFINAYPQFVKKITDVYPRFKPSDLILCIFVFYDFGHTEIGHILQKDRQQISNAMRRISKNLTGKTTSRMDEFKTILEGLQT